MKCFSFILLQVSEKVLHKDDDSEHSVSLRKLLAADDTYSQALFWVPSLVFGVKLPLIPSSASQVQAAKDILDATKPNELIPPHKLASKFYRLSFLEGDPDRPFAIHHQVQSQAFYRMYIDHYMHLRVKPIYDELQRGRVVNILVPLGHNQGGSTAENQATSLTFDIRSAYNAFDDLVDEFWKNYASIYAQKYWQRLHNKREFLIENKDTFDTTYSDLPEDKKAILGYQNKNKVVRDYLYHLRAMHGIAMNHIGSALEAKDDIAQRRASSLLASTSQDHRTDGKEYVFIDEGTSS